MSRPFLNAPSHWLKGTLAPEGDGIVTKVSSGGTPPTSREEYWDGDILWLTPKELARDRDGLFITNTERTISELGLKNCGARILPAGTVLLTKRAPVGLVGIAATPLTTNQGCLNFSCGPNLLPEYLAYWLLGNRPYLDAIAIGSTYPELYKSDLFEFEISIPSLDEQEKCVQFMKSFDFLLQTGTPLQNLVSLEALSGLQQQTARLKDLRIKVLRGLLSGAIPVSELSDISGSEAIGGPMPRKRVSS